MEKSDALWLLISAIYGVKQAARQYYKSVLTHATGHMEMLQPQRDPCVLIKWFTRDEVRKHSSNEPSATVKRAHSEQRVSSSAKAAKVAAEANVAAERKRKRAQRVNGTSNDNSSSSNSCDGGSKSKKRQVGRRAHQCEQQRWCRFYCLACG
jgi:hypothetical protein